MRGRDTTLYEAFGAISDRARDGLQKPRVNHLRVISEFLS